MNHWIIKSFGYALEGIKYCMWFEKNLRLQLLIATITFLAGLYFKISQQEWIAILFCSALVLSLEMINTSIEKLSDKITDAIDPIIKQVKDIAAGAVLLSSIMSFIVGMIIFFPRIKMLLIK